MTLFVVVCLRGVSQVVRAQEKVFTPQELAQFDGKNGHPAYFAFKGKVYDVTKSDLWKEGNHYGVHAGEDLTEKLEGAPHGDEVLATFDVVGTFGSVAGVTPSASAIAVAIAPANIQKTGAWYASPIRIAGISLLGWTGMILGVLFVLNFATCFALPWSKFNLPWMGTRPGQDALDTTKVHLRWTTLHKYFAWGTVAFGIIHGVIGLMQFFGFYL